MNDRKILIRPMIKEDIDFIAYANEEVHTASNQKSKIIKFKERLVNDILSNKPKAYVIVALDGEKPIGMALYSIIYFADEGEVMWLSNIFVNEEYRNNKVAKLMVEYLNKVRKKKGYYAICGTVEDNNELSKAFFNSLNCRWLSSFKMFIIK